jgi:HPt (histidine-containing phosphotransfer) domain-containing protein
MSQKVSIIDFPEALNRTLGDVAFLRTMLYEFQRIAPDFIESIHRALQNEDMDNLAKDAHQLKGAAANLGIKTIASIALELEKLGKNGHSGEGLHILQRMRDAMDQFSALLPTIDWSAL